jgi:uncharacterized membrane-anchored protein YitT (DUF2179 family)
MQLAAKFTALVLGSLLIAVGVNFFLIPFKVLDGGMIGLALILNYLFGFQVGLSIIILSLPIFLLAWLRYRYYFYNSLHGLLISSLFIDLLYPFHFYFMYYVELSSLVSSIWGGLLIGTGIGILLRFDTSTGGTDLAAQFIANALNWNVGVIVLAIDVVVVVLGGVFISAETLFLSLITITVGGTATSICTSRSWGLK